VLILKFLYHCLFSGSNTFEELLSSLQIPPTHTQIAFHEIEIQKELGEGSYGKVCLGKWNAAPVALKFCKNKKRLDDFVQELRLIMYVRESWYLNVEKCE
jgi:serine/threonine protein kinase